MRPVPPRPLGLPTIGLGALLVALFSASGAIRTVLSGHPLPLLGAPGGEVWGHAWVQWWHSDAWPSWPEGPGTWVQGKESWPVIDPLTTFVAAALGTGTDGILAYDALIFIGVATAFIGGALLARVEHGEPLLGGLALALAPSFIGTIASGLTEDLAIGLAAVALGWVGNRDWRKALAAGICLGLLTAFGLVLAWAAAVAATGLGLWALMSNRERSGVARGLAIGALTAGFLTLPTAFLHADRLSGDGHRLGAFVPRSEPLWRLNPWKGIDLASFFVPGHVDPGDALVRMHPGYPGISLMVIALWAGWSRWWVVFLAAIAASVGPHISFAGSPTGLENPLMTLLHRIPFGDLVNHHGRLMLVGAIALSVLAARGAWRIQERHGNRARWVLLLLVGVDLAFLGPVGAPLPTADPTPLAVYTHPDFASLAPGTLLQLPASGPGVHFQRPLLDQRAHRRPLLLDPNRPGLPPALARTETGRFLASLAAPQPTPVPATPTWPAGVAVMVVQAPHIARVESAFGPPILRTADSAAWVP